MDEQQAKEKCIIEFTATISEEGTTVTIYCKTCEKYHAENLDISATDESIMLLGAIGSVWDNIEGLEEQRISKLN